MTRDECYMTFSEALEEYLVARSEMAHFGRGYNWREAKGRLETAAAHMDALTEQRFPAGDIEGEVEE